MKLLEALEVAVHAAGDEAELVSYPFDDVLRLVLHSQPDARPGLAHRLEGHPAHRLDAVFVTMEARASC